MTRNTIEPREGPPRGGDAAQVGQQAQPRDVSLELRLESSSCGSWADGSVIAVTFLTQAAPVAAILGGLLRPGISFYARDLAAKPKATRDVTPIFVATRGDGAV